MNIVTIVVSPSKEQLDKFVKESRDEVEVWGSRRLEHRRKNVSEKMVENLVNHVENLIQEGYFVRLDVSDIATAGPYRKPLMERLNGVPNVEFIGTDLVQVGEFSTLQSGQVKFIGRLGEYEVNIEGSAEDIIKVYKSLHSIQFEAEDY
jgi:hypothetical protein